MSDAAVYAETAGFDAFSCPEIAHDPFIPLALASQRTTKLGLRTAIAVAFARSPMVVANLAWDLHTESGGRFVLGLGTQVQAHVERRFSSKWDQAALAAPRVRARDSRHPSRVGEEGEAALRRRALRLHADDARVLAGADRPRSRCRSTRRPCVPAMIELAGEVSDGVRLHGFLTRKYLEEVAVPALEKGLASRGRPRSNFEVCGGGFVATGPDEASTAKMREIIRYRVAFYASTPSYFPVLDAHGWRPLGEKLRAMTLAGQWQEMSKEISDDVLDAFCVTAPWRDLAPKVAARFGGITDTIELAFPGGSPEGAIREVLHDLHAIPTPCAKVTTSWDDIPASAADPAREKETPHF